MDQSQISAASSPDNSQQRNFDSMEQSPIYQAYPQGSLAAAPWGNQQIQTNQEAFSGFFDNMPWLENDHMAIYDSALYVSSNDASHDVDWSAMQGQQVPMNDYSNPSSIVDSPSSMAEYQGQWAPSPNGYAPTVSTAWMPNSEPFASPLSEAPSYGSETPPYGAEVPGYESYSFAHNQAADNAPAVPTTSFFSDALRVHAAAASPATSPTATSASHRQNIAPTPIKPAKRGPGRPKGSGNKPKLPNGEKAAKGTKRKSPAASPDSSTSDTSMNIGIFPPNVDVKKASQKLQREAWEKCRTEAASLAQRRELLLAARTETQKETEKLQASMGQLREAVARETGQLYEAVRIAARLNTSDYY